jgi:ribosomal protein S27AE
MIEMNVESKKKIKCNECGWSWKLSEGGDDPYTCHKCGYLNKPNNMKKIIKLTESELLSLIERLIYENDPKLRTGKKPKKETQEMKEGELTEKCWPGYTQKGMKTMFGKRYPNCVKKTVKESLDEGEINWKKEKSWKIQDQFPIEVFVEKSWTGKYYVVKVPIMSMSYDTFMDLDNFGKVDISTYDYENGEAKFTSYSLDNIKEWGENNKDKVHINYSRLMNEQISR